MSRNNVRGPTSALTEFLKEQGISARSILERRRAFLEQQAANNAEAGPSNVNLDVNEGNNGENDQLENNEGGQDGDMEEEAAVGSSSPKKRRRNRNGYASDALDETNEERTPSKKRRMTKAQMEKLKAQEKKKAKGRGKKKDEDHGDDSEDDIYHALSKGAAGAGSAVPAPGALVNCIECSKRFTVTKYTISSRDKPGLLCHICVKQSGVDPFKKPTPRKRKDPADKRKVVSFEEPDRVKSLATICIDIIGQHIEDVEALGNIGAINMDKIAKVIAKNRSLTAQNCQLFYDISNTSLVFYDATNLQNDAFCTLGSLNPNLQNLRVDFCGRLTDTALIHWAEHLPALKRIELLGPFLIRADGWKTFFQRLGPQLQGFLLTQSPRFDEGCLDALTDLAVNLRELRLSEIGKMSDGWIDPICKLTNLTSLEITYPDVSLSDDSLVDLLKNIGHNLVHLNLSGNTKLSDVTLLAGILPYAKNLNSLRLSNIPLVTDSGLTEFFKSWINNPALESLDLSKNHLPASDALEALVAHSGTRLTYLNINGWKDTSTAALLELARITVRLVTVDLGWCRNVDNFVIKELLDSCKDMREIKCYGCNKVTTDCPRRAAVKIVGVEGHSQN